MSTELVLKELEKFQENYDSKLSRLDKDLTQLESLMNRADHYSAGNGSSYGGADTPGARLVKETAFIEACKVHGKGRFEVGQLFPTGAKTLIDTTALGSATPGVLAPQRIPGLTPLARRRLRIRDLMRSPSMEGASVDYIKQSGFTNAAYPQTEGSSKAESAITFTVGSAQAATIAHWVPATRQALDDLPELQRFINVELMYGLKLREEVEILRGDGTGDHLLGLMAVASTYAGTYVQASDTIVDRIRHAVLEMNNVDEYPTGIVMNAKDWHDCELLKDEAGGSANTGRYIVADPLGMQIDVPTLWGLAVVVSGTMPPNQFLMGNFAEGAEIRDRMNAVIDISDSHDNYFVMNKIAIRAEERIALPIFRNASFMRGVFS